MLSCSVLCDELNSRGIKATKKNLNLNLVGTTNPIYGVLVETSDVNKEIVFPVDSLLEGASSIGEAADFIQEALNNSKLPEGVDYDYFLKKDYLLSHVQLGLTEKMWQPFITNHSPFEGILEYYYIAGIFRKNRWLIEIREDLINSLGIELSDLLVAAYENTFKQDSDFVLRSVSDIMGKQVKGLIDKSPIKYMFSVSNKLGLQGGVQILNKNILDLFDKYSVEKLVVYPQSENNFLVAPDLEGVLQTMKNIAENDTNFRYLSDNLYLMDKDYKTKAIPFNPVG